MTTEQLKEIIMTGTPAQVAAAVSNRKEVTEKQVRELIKPLREYDIYIDVDNMGQSTWYYIWKKINVKGPHDWNRVNLADCFYWNRGSYNAEGIHSLYDEYGMAL